MSGEGSRPPDDDPARAALAQAKAVAARRGTVPTRRPAAGRDARARDARRREPGRPTAAGPDPDDPQLLGQAFAELVADRGWEATAKAATVLGRWDVLVGFDLAAHCVPESLRDGELVLAAESTAWATQVRLLAGTLLARLDAELGPGVVTTVRVHGPTAPSWRHGPRRVPGRGPRDTYG